MADKQLKDKVAKSTTPSAGEMIFPLPVSMIIGGLAASFGEIITIPLDTAKVRQQVDGEKAKAGGVRKYVGTANTLRILAKEEGILSWYRGLSAGLLRQMVFGTLRLGLYDPVKMWVHNTLKLDSKTLANNITAGVITGAFGILVASPTDRFKVVFQKNPDAYPSLRNAVVSIAKADGVQGLWRGVGANMVRNAIINASELATYDQAKKFLINNNILQDGIPLHFSASFIAGFVATVFGNPVDVIKTRVMGDREKMYKGTLDCVAKTIKNEGPMALYKGFSAQAYRIISWNVCMFMMREQLKVLAYPTFGVKGVRKEGGGH